MQTIDYIYRFDPQSPARSPLRPMPRRRSSWKTATACSRSGWPVAATVRSPRGKGPDTSFNCNGLEVGMGPREGGMPKQTPFAVVVGCSDAACRPR